MRVSATTSAPLETGADTIAVGVFEGEGVAHDPGGLGELLERGEAKAKLRHLVVAHAGGARWIVVGLGAREEFDAERARRAAAAAHGRAKELGARSLCWELPHHVGEEVCGGFVEGTVLAAWSFRGLKSGEQPEPVLEELIVSAHHDVGEATARAAVLAEAANFTRELQETPANLMTPAVLAERAQAIEGVSCEVWDRAAIEGAGMGAFACVARGSLEEPRLIVLRHEPEGAPAGPVLGLVGKAVTFDSGGYSMKPAAGMEAMKFDMSGGAAVLGAMGAIARLRLPLRVLAVVGATENLVNGRAVKPGDVVTAMDGTTIEVNNTDAEGRLVLADCIAHAKALGAERLVDLATLTGGVVTALGSTFGGLMANDEEWAATVAGAGAATGERLWRLPLDEEFREALEGRWADVVNSTDRKAHASIGGQFLARFAGETPWAHLDIAGVAWDTGRAWAPKGGTAFGTRLLVRLAEELARMPG
ncbi:MAG TPA: leucyl aminopeptidase [Solirubrobacteraceae bacterium]|nr:leucyl aminopeptidase [Solirubrobacteraceae bacterium]